MKTSPKIIKIKDVKYSGGYSLRIKFSDETIREVDFEPFLKRSLHPEIRKYLKRKNFSNYIVKDGELMWGDFDLIFPISDLYKNSI